MHVCMCVCMYVCICVSMYVCIQHVTLDYYSEIRNDKKLMFTVRINASVGVMGSGSSLPPSPNIILLAGT